MTRADTSDEFNMLIADIEAEAEAEGPEAVRGLEQLRRELSLACRQLEGRLQRSPRGG